MGGRKFHIRAYVLCIGAITVYVFRESLALFAREAYPDGQGRDLHNLAAHLTNTCAQRRACAATSEDTSDEESPGSDRAYEASSADAAASCNHEQSVQGHSGVPDSCRAGRAAEEVQCNRTRPCEADGLQHMQSAGPACSMPSGTDAAAIEREADQFVRAVSELPELLATDGMAAQEAHDRVQQLQQDVQDIIGPRKACFWASSINFSQAACVILQKQP